MKKTIIAIIAFLVCSIAATAQQQPQESSSFVSRDTVKVVIPKFTDSTASGITYVKAYKVLEIRKGDQSGKQFIASQQYLAADFKPLQNNPLYQFGFDGQLVGYYFNWTEKKPRP